MAHVLGRFDKVAEDYRNADEAHRPFIFSSSDHFTLVLPDLTYSNGVASSDLPTLLFAPDPSGGTHDEAILSACYATARTAKDIVDARLGAEYEGGRHQVRIDMIEEIGHTQHLAAAEE